MVAALRCYQCGSLSVYSALAAACVELLACLLLAACWLINVATTVSCRCCAGLAKAAAGCVQVGSAGVSHGTQGVPNAGLQRRLRQRLLLAGMSLAAVGLVMKHRRNSAGACNKSTQAMVRSQATYLLPAQLLRRLTVFVPVPRPLTVSCGSVVPCVSVCLCVLACIHSCRAAATATWSSLAPPAVNPSCPAYGRGRVPPQIGGYPWEVERAAVVAIHRAAVVAIQAQPHQQLLLQSRWRAQARWRRRCCGCSSSNSAFANPGSASLTCVWQQQLVCASNSRVSV